MENLQELATKNLNNIICITWTRNSCQIIFNVDVKMHHSVTFARRVGSNCTSRRFGAFLRPKFPH